MIVRPETDDDRDSIRRIVDEAHGEVLDLLRTNRSRLDALAEALLEKETLDEDEAYATFPFTTPTVISPSCVAGKPPNVCLKSTA